jgi:peptidoglycan/LPS O-acetylase OafA/YrhL
MVLVMHSGELAVAKFPGSAIDSWILQPAFAVDLGRAGVVLFFALSGFVIPASLCCPMDKIRFPIRRAFRLYPAYWLSILVCLGAEWWLAGGDRSASQIIANLSMLQTFMGYEDIEGLYWTLAVEIAFYVACYALLLAGLIDRGSVLAGIALGLAACWYFVFTGTTSPFHGSHSLVSGLIPPRFLDWPAYFAIMFWSAALRQVVDHKATGRTISAVFVGGLFWLVVMPSTGLVLYFTHQHDASFTGWVLMKYGAFALGLYTFVGLTLLIRIEYPLLRYLGVISFSIYLFHPSIMRLLAGAYTLLVPDLPVAPTVFVATCTLATIAFSAVVYRYVESPAISLGSAICARVAHGRKMRAALPLQRDAR